MSARWTAEEHKTLELLLADGVELDLLKKHLPSRSYNALHRQAQKHGYGVNTVDGVKRLYDGKKTRVHKKKVEEEVTESTNKIVGESRVATTTQKPTITTSESLDNLLDEIIADSTKNSNKDVLIHLCGDIYELLNNEKYQNLKSITVSIEDTKLTVCKVSTAGVTL